MVISADVNITVQAFVQATIEAHRAIPIHIEAGVSVAITVSIDLGLFSIHTHLSFSMTVRGDVTIGSSSHAPWDPDALDAPAPMARLAATTRPLTARQFPPLAVEDRLPLTLYLAPHLTLGDWETGTPVAAYVVGLFVAGPIGRGPDRPASDFEVLARETLLWTLAAFGADDAADLTREQAAAGTVTTEQVAAALAHFTADGPPPLAYDDLRAFLSTHFALTVATPTTTTDLSGAVGLPMLPDLVLGVPAWGGQPAETIDFSTAAMCTPSYLHHLQELLAELAVELVTPLQEQAGPTRAVRPGALPPQSLATFVFEDLFALMSRQMLQAAADGFGRYPWKLAGTETLGSIVDAFDPSNGLTAAGIGVANATLALTTGIQLRIDGAEHQIETGETWSDIATGYGVSALDLATANAEREGLLVAGLTITVGSAGPYLIVGRDTFSSIAGATSTSVADVVEAVGPLADVLVPLAIVAVPTFLHTTVEGDQLGTVAATYGVPLGPLATDNASVGSLFVSPVHAPTFAVVPGLTTLTTGQLLDVLADAHIYVNLAGITTRFLLNGLRLPITPDITLPPDGPLAGATDGGLQQLIGQQVALPPLVATDAGYELTLSAGAQGGWISFPAGASAAWAIDNAATDGHRGQIDSINAVLAAAPAFAPDVTSIAAIDDTRGVARRFVLPTAIPVQATAPLVLPTGPPAPHPTVLPLPDGLLSVLAQPTIVGPALGLQLGEPARSGGGLALTPVRSGAWATLVSVAVERPPPGADTAMAPGTYGLVGTDATGTVLLERLLQAGVAPAAIHLLYPPSAAAAASAGLQLDDPATVSTFVVQADLSTATAPQQAGLRAMLDEAEAPAVVVADPMTSVRLLWECSIVASGGFSLYYESAPGRPGLPEHLFDATGRATLQLLVIHPAGDGTVARSVNAAVVGDVFDGSRTSVIAESGPHTVSVPVEAGATLASLAGGLHLTVSELAGELADEPLAARTTLRVAGGVHEVRVGDTLAALANRFVTTGAEIQASNPDLSIDWGAIPVWTALRLPDTTFTVTDGTTTLATVATQLSVAVAALGGLNATVPLLPASTKSVSVVDQIVDSTAVTPPGTGGFTVVRQQLAGPDGLALDPSDPAAYLDTTFHLLGYRLTDNLGFAGGPSGLPIGPSDPVGDDELQKPVASAPQPATPPASTWCYQQLLPLARSARAGGSAPTPAPSPTAADNPYAGLGAIAQATLEWRDLFGNRARSPLTDPTLDPSGPQNQPPIPVEYTDAILGVARWPSTQVGYRVVAGSTPALEVQLGFEAGRYAGLATSDAARQAAEADRQTLAHAFYQLNQIHPDGTPHITIAVTTSLDAGAPHGLAGADDTAVRGFVLAAWRYLDAILGGAAPPPLPTATVSIPVAATNPADIFELTVALALSRDPALVAASSRDEHGVVDATVAVPPLLADPTSTSPSSMAPFVHDFEQAFTSDDVVVRIGFGNSREGASGGAEAHLLWAVRTSTTPQEGALGCQVTGPPVFWAPPPLSTTPISRSDVDIWPFDPDGTSEPPFDPSQPERHTFTGVDLDVWAAQALTAIDAFLSPRAAVPAFVIDFNGSTNHLDRIRAAKTQLAGAIAETVQGVLSTPPATDQAAIDDAQEAWRQRLLVTLSSAYTVDVAVQLPVEVSATTDPGYGPPAFFGRPVVAPSAEATPDARPFSLSTFKVTTAEQTGHLTFLFTANDPSDQDSVVLDLGYQVDQIEHQIGGIAGIDGYQASTWLTFPHPWPPVPLTDAAPATIEVPVVLRAHPDTPRLTAQTSSQALDPTSPPATLLQTALQWTHGAQYAEQHVAQDVTWATTIFNVAPAGPQLMAQPTQDLFAPLARLISALPALQSVFDTDLPALTPASRPGDPDFVRAARAVEAFTRLVADVADSWGPISSTGVTGAAPVETGQPFTFEIAEARYPTGGEDLLVTVTPDPRTPRPDGVPVPAVVFAGFEPEPIDPADPAGGVRYRYLDPTKGTYLSWEDARAIPGRTVETGPLDVLRIENAQMGVQLVRNAVLVEGNPTQPEFIYQTPLVTFTSPHTPLLSVADRIDIASLATGAPVARPLVDQLQAMFAGVFAAVAPGTAETIQLQVGYAFDLASDLPDGALPPIVVPITLVPSAELVVPDHWWPAPTCAVPTPDDAPFVCRLADVIRSWVAANQPTPVAELTFDLTVYSTLSASSLPLARLGGLVLRRADITDLPPTPSPTE